jgi:hypothetical protein
MLMQRRRFECSPALVQSPGPWPPAIDRRPNFDIYLPEWLARYNKEVFGTLFVGGPIYAMVVWL